MGLPSVAPATRFPNLTSDYSRWGNLTSDYIRCGEISRAITPDVGKSDEPLQPTWGIFLSLASSEPDSRVKEKRFYPQYISRPSIDRSIDRPTDWDSTEALDTQCLPVKPIMFW